MKNETFLCALCQRAKKQLRLIRSISGSPELAGIEGVHDLRVALRRLRSILLLAGAGALEKRLRPLARALGAARDLDVLMERIRGDVLTGGIGASNAKTWISKLAAERDAAFAAAKIELDGTRTKRWLNDVKTWAGRKAGGPTVEEALPSILLEHATAIEALGEPTTEEGLHELRIECKRLRYLLEFFDDHVAGARKSISRLTEVQDVLGGNRDLQVAASAARREGLTAYAEWLEARLSSIKPGISMVELGGFEPP